MLQYSIKFSISLAVLFIFYRAFLRPLTFYQWNRFYLLSYSLLSFVIPFIDISSYVSRSSNQQLVNIIPAVTSYNFTTTVKPVVEVSWLQRFTATDWLLIVFCTGALVMLVRIFVQYIALRNIRHGAVLLNEEGDVRLYETKAAVSPFSFGNAIYFNRSLHTEEELQRIVQHEFVHVKQKHTIDLLLGELLCVVNWYNPFAWFIRYSIRQNLEFIADNNVVANGLDKKEYQYLLLKVVGIPQYSIANNFNFSNLKKRIAMMNKMKSAKLHLTKFLFVLPLLAVLLLAFRNKLTRDNKTFVFTGIVYDAKTAQPLADVGINEKYSRMAATTDANGFFKMKIPIEGDSIFKLSCNFYRAGYVTKDDQNLSFSPSKVKTYADLVFTGMRQEDNASYDGLTVSTHYQVPMSDEKQFIADPDYSFVQQKYIAFQKGNQSSDKIDLLIKDSKKPIWIIDGAAYAIGNGAKAWFNKDENNIAASFKVWVDGKIMSMDEANALVNRFEVSTVAACFAEYAQKKFGVNSNLLVLYWKTKPASEKNAKDTIPPPPPPVPVAPVTNTLPVSPVIPATPAMPPVNNHGYIISVADNHGECIVLVKDKSQKIIKAQSLTDWNKNKKENESKYGEVPPAPPPVPNFSIDPGTDPPLSTENIQLRGPSKLLSEANKNIPADMLVIIDGVEATADYNLNNLKGEDIKVMNIRKGKDATDMYGEKGKHNVIEITTKKYKLEKKDDTSYKADSSVRMHFDQFIVNGGITTNGNESIIDGAFSFENKTERPFVVFDGHEFLELITCAPPRARYRMVTLNPKEAIGKYGDKAKYGAIEITTLKPSQLQNKKNETVTITADKITWDKAHLIITGGSMIQDGQTSLITGDIGFDSDFSAIPMVIYNGKQVTDFNSFKLTKVKVSILSLDSKESIAKYGSVAKNGAVEINKL